VLATADAAETWFAENDPENVAFEYEVLEEALVRIPVLRFWRSVGMSQWAGGQRILVIV